MKEYFKDYSNSGILTVTPHDIAYTLLTAYNLPTTWVDQSGSKQYYGEAMLDIIAHSTLDNFSANTEGIIRALYYLNRKVEAARKTFSFWDSYQIRDTIQDKNNLLGQLAAMPVNSSIISSSRDPFEWKDDNQNTTTVYQGDVFIKDYYERIHLIHTLSTGFYVPVNITQGENNNYTIQFQYESAVTPEDEEKNLKITIDTTQWKGYNFSALITAGQTNSDLTIVYDSDSEDPIYPMVKIFMSTNNGYEQVFIDKSYELDLSNNKINLYNNTDCELLFEVK